MFCKECGKYSADKETKCVYCGGEVTSDVKYRKTTGSSKNFWWLGMIVSLASLGQGIGLGLLGSLVGGLIFNKAFFVVVTTAVFAIVGLFLGLMIVSFILKGISKESFTKAWSITFFVQSIVSIVAVLLYFIILMGIF